MKFDGEPRLSVEKKEREPRIIPVIDIVRHGETEYKELQDKTFKFDPESSDFALDAEHLDLTQEGIENIEETAERLASTIDKDNEVVILVSSPQYRAMSTILIIEKVLAEKGITVLNSSEAKEEGRSNGIKESEVGLGQIPQAGDSKAFIEAHQQYTENNPETANMPPAQRHALVAENMGRELSEIFSKSHQQITAGFTRFLRHLINIDYHLQDDTKSALKDKKLRIICVTHEERISEFAKDAFNMNEAVAKGQRIELSADDILEENSDTEAQATIYGKKDNKDHTEKINIAFTEDGIRIEQVS